MSNDRVYQRTIATDTLYFKSAKFAIKKYKGYYFLNKKVHSDMWLTTTLRITDKGLLLGHVMSKVYIDFLADHSTSEPDSLAYVKLSDRELRIFLEDQDFKNERKFVRREYDRQQKR